MSERSIEIEKTATLLWVEQSEVIKLLSKDITHSEMRLWYVCMGHIIPKWFEWTQDYKWRNRVKIIT